MKQYCTVRASSWDLDALITKLNDEASHGWSVVSVVNTGSDIAAILERGDSPASSATVATPEVTQERVVREAATVSVPAPAPEPEPVQVAVEPTPEPEPVAEPAGWGAAIEPTPSVASDPSPSPSAAVQPEPTPAAVTTATSAIPATPAGWYPDPSGRFEMRYWDGNAWTEHVARGGQQYTDPPVA